MAGTQIMNAKECFVAAILLNVVLLTFAASYYRTWRDADEPSVSVLSGPAGQFGPVIETVLPVARIEGTTDLLDMETGRARPQPAMEDFNFCADEIVAWISSNGMDVSCFVWPSGGAFVTYAMAIVPVDGKCWEETTEEELLANPALAPGGHCPRRLLVLGHDRPDTYMFRTSEGSLGMLQLAGLPQHQQGVKIRYKLINPAESPAVAIRLPVPKQGF